MSDWFEGSESGGAPALTLLQTSAVDLLISDQMMVPKDGWALLCQVREHYPELPVLLDSARPPLRPRWVPRIRRLAAQTC